SRRHPWSKPSLAMSAVGLTIGFKLLPAPKLVVENVAPLEAERIPGLVIAPIVEMIVEHEAVECFPVLAGLVLRRRLQPGAGFPGIGRQRVDRGSGVTTRRDLALDAGPESLTGWLRHHIELDRLKKQIAVTVCLQKFLRFLDGTNEMGCAVAGNGI